MSYEEDHRDGLLIAVSNLRDEIERLKSEISRLREENFNLRKRMAQEE